MSIDTNKINVKIGEMKDEKEERRKEKVNGKKII